MRGRLTIRPATAGDGEALRHIERLAHGLDPAARVCMLRSTTGGGFLRPAPGVGPRSFQSG
ncbi:MAG: hypothetical protein QOH36_677 [Actinomycetota bacterium]|nr:hypothetical protein [Actinomycetota bacterium]